MSANSRIITFNRPFLMGTSILAEHHPRGLDNKHLGVWIIMLIHAPAVLRCDHQTMDLQSNDLLAVKPGTRLRIDPPSSSSRDPANWHWIALADQPRFQRLLRYPQLGPGLGRVHLADRETAAQVHRAVADLEAACTVPALPRRGDLLLNIAERLLLWAAAANPELPAIREDPRIERAILYLRVHFDEPLCVERLAEEAGWAPSHFAHRFREETGMSPMRYLETVRMRNACDLLLETTLDLEDIAQRCGFSNAGYFSRVFRKHWGMPPGRWREENRLLSPNELKHMGSVLPIVRERSATPDRS